MKRDRLLYSVSVVILVAILALWYRLGREHFSGQKIDDEKSTVNFFPTLTPRQYEIELVQYNIARDQASYEDQISGCGCG